MLSPNVFSIKKCCETSRASVGLFLRVGGGKTFIFFVFVFVFVEVFDFIALCQRLAMFNKFEGVNYSGLHLGLNMSMHTANRCRADESSRISFWC